LGLTKSQLTSAQRELNAVQLSSRQQAGLLCHAASTLTSLADQMNKVITVNEKNEPKPASSSDVTE